MTRKAIIRRVCFALAILCLVAIGGIVIRRKLRTLRIHVRADWADTKSRDGTLDASGAPSYPPGRLGSLLDELGYRIKAEKEGSVCWREWEKERFGLLSKREWFAKNSKPVPGSSDTFYRFRIWEEAFSSPKKAQARLEQLWVVPGCAPAEQQEYWMATGFRCGVTAYILHTDVAGDFQLEMKRVAEKLEKEISNGP